MVRKCQESPAGRAPPGTVAVHFHRLRARLQELVRAEVARTVGSAAQVEEEMKHLLAVWQR